jgi:thioredoxin 1
LKVDVDEVPEVAEEAGVRSMPTFHVYKGGKKVEGMVGAMRSQLEGMVKRYAY